MNPPLSPWLLGVWTAAAFLSGSLPWSVWVGRMAAGVDIRTYGDHNPGATNVFRAVKKGWGWGLLAVLLDGFKGAIPVGLAWFWGDVGGWQILPVALAPILGHAFSPWLGFRGGKAVAVTFGVWTGLTAGVGPTVLGLLLALAVFTVQPSGWAVMFTLAGFGIFVFQQYAGVHPVFIWVWAGCTLILAWKHRSDLSAPLRLKIPGRRAA